MVALRSRGVLYLAFMGLFTQGVQRRRSLEYISTCQQGEWREGGVWGRTPRHFPPFISPSIDVRCDWQLYRLTLVFGLQFVAACHPIRQLSPSGGTNPTGHYEAGLIPTTAAAEAFQGGFWSMMPCLSHASVGFRHCGRPTPSLTPCLNPGPQRVM